MTKLFFLQLALSGMFLLEVAFSPLLNVPYMMLMAVYLSAMGELLLSARIMRFVRKCLKKNTP